VLVRGFDEVAVIINRAVRRRILGEDREDAAAKVKVVMIAGDDFEAQRLGPACERLQWFAGDTFRKRRKFFFRPFNPQHMVIASAAAVASSSSEALAISMPVRSVIIVWKLKQSFEAALRNLRLGTGVYWVYQPGFSRRFVE